MKYSLAYRFALLTRRSGLKLNELKQPEVINMRKEIASLGKSGIEFKVEQHPDGSWTAESTNVEGIFTGGHAQENIPESIKDAVFTYYGIPAKYCVDELLRGTGEPIVTQQELHIVA